MPITPHAATDLFRASPHRFIDVGGDGLGSTEVAYWKVGTGPDVVFSHGWPANSATFRLLLPHLADHVTCHLFDYPGAGQSRFDRTIEPSITNHAEALRRVVDRLELSSTAVVGHDSGGMIARFALAADPRVTGWGLVATEQPPRAHWRFSSFLMVRHIPRFENLLATAVNQPMVRRNKFVLGDVFADKSLLDGEFAEFYLAPLADDAERLWAAGEFGRNFDLGLFAQLTELHRLIEVPVQLVWGGRDPFFPVEATRAMMADFGGPVSLEVIDEGKLFVHEEFPEQTAKALLPSLQALDAP